MQQYQGLDRRRKVASKGNQIMKPTFALLATGIALAAFSAANAYAAKPSAAGAAAPAADAAPAVDAPEDGGEVVVLGFGRGRQEQEVTAADIGRLTPGS